jgi:hypothetical protein
MPSRLNDRLKRLEARISPKPPSRVFTLVIDDGGLSHDEQVEAFEAKTGVTPHDHLVVMTFA